MFAANRVVRTLEEAWRRCRTLPGMLAGAQDASIDDLDLATGSHNGRSRERTRPAESQARTVARGMEINGRVLRGAMSRDRFMHAICGGAPTRSYEPGESASAIGALLNRQV